MAGWRKRAGSKNDVEVIVLRQQSVQFRVAAKYSAPAEPLMSKPTVTANAPAPPGATVTPEARGPSDTTSSPSFIRRICNASRSPTVCLCTLCTLPCGQPCVLSIAHESSYVAVLKMLRYLGQKITQCRGSGHQLVRWHVETRMKDESVLVFCWRRGLQACGGS